MTREEIILDLKSYKSQYETRLQVYLKFVNNPNLSLKELAQYYFTNEARISTILGEFLFLDNRVKKEKAGNSFLPKKADTLEEELLNPSMFSLKYEDVKNEWPTERKLDELTMAQIERDKPSEKQVKKYRNKMEFNSNFNLPINETPVQSKAKTWISNLDKFENYINQTK
jgi:hypothetical protein